MERTLKVKLAYNKGYRVTKSGKVLNPAGSEVGFVIANLDYKYWVFKMRFGLSKKSIPVKVSRLQAYQKFGEKIFEENMVVRHLNGDSLDNSFDNIGIGTQLENLMDIEPKQRILNCLGSTKATRKYDRALVEKIRLEKMKGSTLMELSRKYEIPKSSLHHILNNKYLDEKISENLL